MIASKAEPMAGTSGHRVRHCWATVLVSGVALGLTLTPPLAAALARQPSSRFDRLTVPHERLPVGCALTPSRSAGADGKPVRGGESAGLAITSNPWSGDDRPIVAAIRERLMVSPPVPDGPPPSRRELARFRLQLAEDVNEAYVAIYADAGPNLVVVHAATFNDTTNPADLRAAATSRGGVFMPDRTVVMVSGVGACFEAVAAHVKTLARP